MLPIKKPIESIPSLINNTQSIRRRPVEEFDPKNKQTLKKNSKVYVMLKHGPLPDGNYSYLISNGALTRYARWLLIACDLKISFMTLLVLSRIYRTYINARGSDNLFIVPDVLREQLYGPMGFDFNTQSIVDMISTLKKQGYCELGVWRSLRGIPYVMDKLEEKYDSELRELYDYFDEIFQSNIYNQI